MTTAMTTPDYRQQAHCHLDAACQHTRRAGAVVPDLEHHPGIAVLTRRMLAPLCEEGYRQWSQAADGTRTLRLYPGLLGNGHAVALMETFNIRLMLRAAQRVQRAVGDVHNRLPDAVEAVELVKEAWSALKIAHHAADLARRNGVDVALVATRLADIESRLRPMERCAARALYHATRLMLLDARTG